MKHGLVRKQIISVVVITLLLVLLNTVFSYEYSYSVWADSSKSDFHGIVTSIAGSPVSEWNGEESPLRKGSRVLENHSVITGPEEEVILRLSTGDELVITEFSMVKVARSPTDDEVVNLIQNSGFVWSKVKSTKKKNRFNVTTPTAVAGVRGTSFSVQVDPKNGQADFCVCEGQIDVDAGGKKQELNAGQSMTTSKNSVGAPFMDHILLKYPKDKNMVCLTCHQGGGDRDGHYR